MTNTTSPTTVPEPVEVSAQQAALPRPIAQTRALSIVSLVLSASAILLGQIPLAIGGIVAGFIARRDEPAHRTFSTWGIVLGFVGVFGWLVFAMIGVAAIFPIWLGHVLGS